MGRTVASPASAVAGTSITLDATGSNDAETQQELDYVWNFGNGEKNKDASGALVSHT